MKVGLSGPLVAAANGSANGSASIEIEAETIRQLLTRLVDRYPLMQQQLDDGIAVSINGAIYRDNWTTKIPEDSDVFLLPRIAGG